MKLSLEYSDVTPTKLPPRLPLTRGMEHHVDLVPETVLPSRPAYNSNPNATIGLQEQIAELISRVIREFKEEKVLYVLIDNEIHEKSNNPLSKGCNEFVRGFPNPCAVPIYHSQVDEQTEEINHTWKQMLRSKKLYQCAYDQTTTATEISKRRTKRRTSKVVFQPGELIWLPQGKERFPFKMKSKLVLRVGGIGDDEYQISLKEESEIQRVFYNRDLPRGNNGSTKVEIKC